MKEDNKKVAIPTEDEEVKKQEKVEQPKKKLEEKEKAQQAAVS